MKKLFFLFLVLAGIVMNKVNAQNVGIGTLSPDPGAKLDITDTARGILIPRMTSLQRDAIASPALGLLVFVTSDSSFYYYKGGWKKMMDNKEGWGTSGNSVSGSNDFIGTTNPLALLFRIGNHNAGQLQPDNLNVGFGLSTLDSFATGMYNTAIGSAAAPIIRSGSYNTAIGTGSMYKTYSGNGNSGMGAYSLFNNRTGIYNTAIGTFAGMGTVTGNNNTLIGAYADVTDSAITNATAIGFDAKVSLSNSLVLGGIGAYAVNVGIGTTAPHAPLQFANINGRKLVLYENGANDNKYYGFAIAPSTLRYQTYGEHAFFVGTSDTTSLELMRIKSNGNVGIGNSNPQQKLDVSGKGVIRDSLGIGTIFPQQRLDVSGKATVKDSLGIGVSSPHAPLQFANANGRKLVLYEDAVNDNKYYGFAIAPSTLRYQTAFDHAFFVGTSDTTSLELMRLTRNGNVGIGNSNPQQKLDVAGKVTVRDSIGIGTSSPQQRLDVAGKATVRDSIGIGTSSPQQRLDVAGNAAIKDSVGIGMSSPHAPLQFANTAGRKLVLFEDGINDNEYYGLAIDPSTLRFQSNNDFAFFEGISSTSSTELMRISSSGNVGIGTNTIQEKLTVNGAVKIADGGYTGLTQNAVTPVPAGGAGTIAFSNNHFFGWNGTAWKQLDN